jgi:hypothetical protein
MPSSCIEEWGSIPLAKSSSTVSAATIETAVR